MSWKAGRLLDQVIGAVICVFFKRDKTENISEELICYKASPYIKMVLLTMIARQQDGLPLAASVQEDEQVCYG